MKQPLEVGQRVTCLLDAMVMSVEDGEAALWVWGITDSEEPLVTVPLYAINIKPERADRNRQIWHLRYRERWKVRAIATRFGISQQRVSQILKAQGVAA